MIKANVAMWHIASALLNRLAFLQRAKDLRAAQNWQPSLIPLFTVLTGLVRNS